MILLWLTVKQTLQVSHKIGLNTHLSQESTIFSYLLLKDDDRQESGLLAAGEGL